jgi:hypothetical protein
MAGARARGLRAARAVGVRGLGCREQAPSGHPALGPFHGARDSWPRGCRRTTDRTAANTGDDPCRVGRSREAVWSPRAGWRDPAAARHRAARDARRLDGGHSASGGGRHFDAPEHRSQRDLRPTRCGRCVHPGRGGVPDAGRDMAISAAQARGPSGGGQAQFRGRPTTSAARGGRCPSSTCPACSWCSYPHPGAGGRRRGGRRRRVGCWVGAVSRLDPAAGRVVARIRTPDTGDYSQIAFAARSTWVTTGGGVAHRIDSLTNRVVATVHVGGSLKHPRRPAKAGADHVTASSPARQRRRHFCSESLRWREAKTGSLPAAADGCG